VLSNVERQEQLLRYLEQHRRATVQELCQHFSISMATARRDLEALAGQGKITRFHGGAMIARQAPPEPPALQRTHQQAAEKRRIGQATARLVSDGETIFLGSGTTVLEVARALRHHHDLTVITNSVPVMTLLADAPAITLIGLGGLLRRSEMSLIGHLTEQSLAGFHCDRVIMGIRAIDIERGLSNDYLGESMTDRAILSLGSQVIVVADHTKCGFVSTAFLAPVTVMHTLVTDSKTSPEFIAALRQLGIQVVVA